MQRAYGTTPVVLRILHQVCLTLSKLNRGQRQALHQCTQHVLKVAAAIRVRIMHLPHRGHILTDTHPGKKAGFSPFFIVGALLRGPEIIILFSGQMQLSFGNIHPENEPIVGGL